MTAQELHDALGLLPSDLITAADRVRTGSAPKVIRWQKWVSLAAVLALVAGTTLVFQRNIGFDSLKGGSAAPESAMQQAPAPVEDEVAADEVIPEEPAAEAPKESANTTNSTAMGGDETGMEIDHSHRFAEPGDPGEDVPSGYCGNLTVTVTIAGESHFLTGADSLAMTEILRDLPYDPSQVCRCMTDITVDTETLKGIQLNLTEAFARCELGQAALTEEQAKILQDIIDSLQ